jgi:hypothetical protein
MVKLGGGTGVVTVSGAVVGELAEARRREAVAMANGETDAAVSHHQLRMRTPQ